MIGFYDPHLFESSATKLNLPNVDIMKLATYYKEQNEYGRLILPNESVGNYDKIYCFSEVPCTVPDTLKRASNVIYGGSYFTNGEYIPFEDSLINYTAPKIGVYYDYLKQCPQEPKIINDFLDNAYYRIGKEQLPYPAPVVRRGHKVYIYDNNLTDVPNWERVINELDALRPRSIICVHPIICTKLSYFFKLRSLNRFSRGDNNLVLNLAIPSEDIGYLFKNYLHLFQADIMPSSKVYLHLGGNLSSNSAYYQDFIYALNLLYCFWAKGIPMKIWYKEPTGGYHSPIHNLSRMVASWSEKRGPQSLNELFNKSTPDPRKDEKELLLRNFPNSGNLFIQNYELLTLKKYWGF